MLQYLHDYKGTLTVNGKLYESVNLAEKALDGYTGKVVIDISTKVSPRGNDEVTEAPQHKTSNTTAVTTAANSNTVYKIKVRQYMTKAPTAEFDFHTKWNGGIAMPMRIMVGKKLQETPGMVKMELWGAITGEQTTHCMKCGRVLNHTVSRYFGIGPECGMHNYKNPFETDEELKTAIAVMKNHLSQIKWTGWIIKSAIEESEIVNMPLKNE